MSVLTVVSPGLKVLFERIGRPEIINQPELLRLGRQVRSSPAITLAGQTAYGWPTPSYPRQLRYMSKEELFSSLLA